MQCLVTVIAAESNMWSGLELKCFGRPPEAKLWRILCPNGSPKQLAALLGWNLSKQLEAGYFPMALI